MTTINSLTPEASTSGASEQANINANFDLFISLLTTQVQNQDPLEPLDSSEYTNQLVQYSMVEQQIATTEKLEEQLTQLKTQSASQFVNYIGKEVTAQGGTTELKDGHASWNLDATSEGDATITIFNDEGAEIYQEEIVLEKGDNTFEWDGVGSSGTNQGDGAYSIEIVTKDANGEPFVVQAEINGVVDGIDFSTGVVILQMGELEIPVGDVTGVQGIL
ncbi:Basal-body rod modification protein FlgD [Pseudovibrio axinellae]|uniref:Basal-body rod modification protein FlgD n=1 Tax=Pseudovibrio axinellae TaxID=989403 RepID=A0A165XSY2_9HYPH|nr:flagellar hook capping FlgD N-terminal domain-containing protein [Pseudovibrio axinellae]KZL18007.1 Basal-body rod modification protein FlgD [Pseudovibrio axinellae]SER13728.1 flagellar basal-body rod modification protein FlgD [Pseudovibrio axinellae]